MIKILRAEEKQEDFSPPSLPSPPDDENLISHDPYADSEREEFPPLIRRSDTNKGIQSRPFVSPSEVLPDGKLKGVTQAEEVLNWQTHNMVAQNSYLQKIDTKLERVTDLEIQIKQMSNILQRHYKELKEKISSFESQVLEALRFQGKSNMFLEKEAELRRAKEKYEDLKEYVQLRLQPKSPFDDPFFKPARIFSATLPLEAKMTPLFPPNLEAKRFAEKKRMSHITMTLKYPSASTPADPSSPRNVPAEHNVHAEENSSKSKEEIHQPGATTMPETHVIADTLPASTESDSETIVSDTTSKDSESMLSDKFRACNI
ncbi:hypothetical protein Fmac_029423 [Flemingia macrophylla]|uniref:Uncharacterized protein n=1 Tax=Flemingia macrophylla TaxID=520843 RepID=A0ABD1LAA3_9FABA